MEEIGVLHFLRTPKRAALCPTVDLVAVLGNEYLAVYRFTGKVVWSRRVEQDAEIKWNADGILHIRVLDCRHVSNPAHKRFSVDI
jgi:acyl-homoserine lactone acylase PvdQ